MASRLFQRGGGLFSPAPPSGLGGYAYGSGPPVGRYVGPERLFLPTPRATRPDTSFRFDPRRRSAPSLFENYWQDITPDEDMSGVSRGMALFNLMGPGGAAAIGKATGGGLGRQVVGGLLGARAPAASPRVFDPPPVGIGDNLMPPSAWSPEDWAAFGREHGVENLGPLTADAPVRPGGLEVPGGAEGRFTYYDLLDLKARGINPAELPEADRIPLYKKLARSVAPTGDIENPDLFNRYMFGMLSPNTPLTPNELGAARMFVRSDEDIASLADMIPWEVGDDVTKAQRAEASDRIAEFFNIQPRGQGGLGLKSSVDYSTLGEFAQLFRQDPNFFKKQPDESWSEMVERVASQTQGLGTKTGSFSVVWQDPLNAGISAIDRHMAREALPDILPTQKARREFERDRVRFYNDLVEAGDERVGDKKIRSFDQLFANKGGAGLVMDALMTRLNAKGGKLRTAKGEINPRLPKHLQETTWIKEPEAVKQFSDTYRLALRRNAREAEERGLALFPQQWMVWDTLRQRLEPHEAMFSGLHKLPPMAHAQLEAARQAHKDAGFLSGSKTEQLNPVTGEMEKMLNPVRSVDNPSSLGYFSVTPTPLPDWVFDPDPTLYEPDPMEGVI